MAARIILAAFAWLMLTLPQAAMAKRVALIIANSNYTAVPALKNPVADAKLVTGALKQAGFASIDVRLDLDKAAMEAALRDFSRKADGADVALIYYAGHGIEAGGQNYLIPADAKLVQDRDLDIEATRLDTVLAIGDGARMRIVILDACRNNPFTASMQRTIRRRAIGRGLAAIEPEGETLVVYAAKAGAFAEDGLGDNSPFAAALAKRLPQPGLEIGLLFRAVRDDVLSATDQVQEPFTYGSLSGTAFYFVPPSGKPATGTSRPSAAETARTRETLLWQGALNANTSGAYQEYLRAYPKGSYAEIARQNLSRIAQAAVPARPLVFPLPSQQPGFVLPKPDMPPGLGRRPGDYDIGEVMSRPIRLSALATAPPAADGDVTRGQFYYIPQGRIRFDLKRAFLDRLRSGEPAMASALVPKFEARDPFAELEDVLEPSSLSPSVLPDALARTITVVMQMQTGTVSDSKADLESTRALSQQIALILIRDPNFRSLTMDQQQVMTDSAWLTLWLIRNTFTSQVGSAKARGDYARAMLNGLKTHMGVDLTKLRITSRGIVPR